MRIHLSTSWCVLAGLALYMVACGVDDPTAASDEAASVTSDEGSALTAADGMTVNCGVLGTGCQTPVLSANSVGHSIAWGVSSGASGNGCSWRVRDVDTNVVVGSGRVGAFSTGSGVIHGLFGRYRNECFSCLTGAACLLRD